VENASEVVPPQVTSSPPQVTVSVDWSDYAAERPEHVNQAMAQLGVPASDGVPDGVYVVLGNVLPPVMAPGPDVEVQKRLAELQGTTLKVDIVGRFHMSRGLLDAIIQVLQTTAAQYDAAVRQAQAGKSPEQR
jgi:hypothetical protein